MKKIRCAIYTRKSSEEGLEQDFNSLDAQREACEAYVASQRHEGWVLLPTHYDDGGISGGTLERPALQQLLNDVDEGLVDQIVVYKIDRLTRSLADFAKLVERLDKADASFVSVTQSFNTATSMGRLTLNVLLSFAQFEREVTAERIRDKIAASKQKGLWMGGQVPLGYEANGRSLKISPEEAATVRTLFELYLKHGTVRHVREEAQTLGVRSRTNRLMGYGHIHHILTNPIYTGMIRHKDQVYEGNHQPIVESEIWETIQTKLKSKASKARLTRTRAKNRSLLAGKLKDETGDKLVPSHANKNGRRYRYYVSFRLIRPETASNRKIDDTAKNPPYDRRHDGWRLPAEELEQQVMASVVSHIQGTITGNQFHGLSAGQFADLHASVDDLKHQIGCERTSRKIVGLIDQIALAPGKLSITLIGSKLAALLGVDKKVLDEDILTFSDPFQIRKRGVETKLVLEHSRSRPDPVLVQNLAKAHHWYGMVKAGSTVDEISEAENLSVRRIRQLIELAFIAPDITRMILNGQQPVGLTSEWLLRHKLPVCWKEQRALISTL